MSDVEDDPLNLESRLDELWQDQQSSETQGAVRFGQTVGQYKIRAFLGSGSFGLVYLADDQKSGRPVALKLPRIEVLLDQEKRKRFRVEAEIIGRLNHPGIVRVLRSDVDDAMPYIACDWYSGPDLAAYLANLEEEDADLPTWEESVRLAELVCEAIDFAHENGITHRDIKPANIILDRKIVPSESASGLDLYTARITDFGLARLAEPTAASTRTGVVMGTPAYMAPERIIAGLGAESQSLGHEKSMAADIYSLGAVLFELLTGKSPQVNSWLELVREESSRKRQAIDWGTATVPDGLKKIVETCLRRNPEARYASAGAVAEDLNRVLTGESPVGCAIGVEQRLRMWFQGRNWMSVAGKFAMGSQAIMATWLMLADIFKIPFGLLSVGKYFGLLPQLLLIAVMSSLTVIVAGWYCAQRKLLAALMGIFVVGVNLYTPVRALLGEPQVFREIYQSTNPYMSFQVHLVIAITFSVQLILFILAAVDGLLARKSDPSSNGLLR